MEWLFGKQETPEQKMQREKMEMDMAKQAEEERVAQVETGVYANAPPAPRGYRAAYGGPATYGNPASYGGKSRRNKSKGGTRKSKGGTRKGGRSRKTRKGGRRH